MLIERVRSELCLGCTNLRVRDTLPGKSPTSMLSIKPSASSVLFGLRSLELIRNCIQNSEEHSDILTNLNAAQKHLDFLTSGFLHALDALPGSVSAALQTAPPPQQQQQQVASVSALASASAVAAETQKPKKVRAKRVPKGVVPGVTPPPDPERWLKKSERTSFGQGNRRRKGGGGGGATQGAMEPAGTGAKSSGGGKGKKRK